MTGILEIPLLHRHSTGFYRILLSFFAATHFFKEYPTRPDLKQRRLSCDWYFVLVFSIKRGPFSPLALSCKKCLQNFYDKRLVDTHWWLYSLLQYNFHNNVLNTSYSISFALVLSARYESSLRINVYKAFWVSGMLAWWIFFANRSNPTFNSRLLL